MLETLGNIQDNDPRVLGGLASLALENTAGPLLEVTGEATQMTQGGGSAISEESLMQKFPPTVAPYAFPGLSPLK